MKLFKGLLYRGPEIRLHIFMILLGLVVVSATSGQNWGSRFPSKFPRRGEFIPDKVPEETFDEIPIDEASTAWPSTAWPPIRFPGFQPSRFPSFPQNDFDADFPFPEVIYIFQCL